jgi:predicted MarR family transcription regulator
VQSVPNFQSRLRDAAATLDLLTGIYEQAARTAATHRRFHG